MNFDRRELVFNRHLFIQQTFTEIIDTFRSFKASRVSRSKRVPSLGSGCSSVGRAVASDLSGHRETLYYLFTVNCIEKTKIKEKRGRGWPIFKKRVKAGWRDLLNILDLAETAFSSGFTKWNEIHSFN